MKILDEDNFVYGIFVDLEKTFVTVDHNKSGFQWCVSQNAIYFSIISMPKNSKKFAKKFYYFCDTTLCAKFESVSLFCFFTLRLFTLESPTARLTHEFHKYCWDYVCRVNVWCLVGCFHHKFRVSCLRRAFNTTLDHFSFLQLKIFTLIWTMHIQITTSLWS